jgi:hypothetical protein
MDANTIWARLDAALQELGLARLVQYADLTDVDDQSVNEARCPSQDTVQALLPESYRRFVATYRCPAVWPWELADGENEELDEDAIGDALRFFEFLPYHGMRWATGTMGDPSRDWMDVRAERERGEYRWEYVMFAAFDAAEGCGWAFWPTGDESAGTGEPGEPQVWYVEDSLPTEQVGTFAEWLDARIAETLNGLASLGLFDAPALE